MTCSMTRRQRRRSAGHVDRAGLKLVDKHRPVTQAAGLIFIPEHQVNRCDMGLLLHRQELETSRWMTLRRYYRPDGGTTRRREHWDP